MKEILFSNTFLISVAVVNLVLILLYVLNSIKLSKLRKSYSEFMSRLGKGTNIEEILKEYINTVDGIKTENEEIKKYCEKIDLKADLCICKTGLVRYNAYKDTGSNLSFALALLNKNDDGIVLNGIYARDSSNIFCKTIKAGVPEYAVSEEEKEAIEKAMGNKDGVKEK